MDEPGKPLVAVFHIQRLLIRALERLGFKAEGAVRTSLDSHGKPVIQLQPGGGERLIAWLEGLNPRVNAEAAMPQVRHGDAAVRRPAEPDQNEIHGEE